MSRFTRIFSGKFQYLGNCAGVKHLTNIMSVTIPGMYPCAHVQAYCRLLRFGAASKAEWRR